MPQIGPQGASRSPQVGGMAAQTASKIATERMTHATGAQAGLFPQLDTMTTTSLMIAAGEAISVDYAHLFPSLRVFAQSAHFQSGTAQTVHLRSCGRGVSLHALHGGQRHASHVYLGPSQFAERRPVLAGSGDGAPQTTH